MTKAGRRVKGREKAVAAVPLAPFYSTDQKQLCALETAPAWLQQLLMVGAAVQPPVVVMRSASSIVVVKVFCPRTRFASYTHAVIDTVPEASGVPAICPLLAGEAALPIAAQMRIRRSAIATPNQGKGPPEAVSPEESETPTSPWRMKVVAIEIAERLAGRRGEKHALDAARESRAGLR